MLTDEILMRFDTSLPLVLRLHVAYCGPAHTRTDNNDVLISYHRSKGFYFEERALDGKKSGNIMHKAVILSTSATPPFVVNRVLQTVKSPTQIILIRGQESGVYHQSPRSGLSKSCNSIEVGS